MFIAVMMALGVTGGYLVTVLISMILTFALTMALPKFVEADHLVRNGYKLVHEGFWLLCAATGGYVTALVVKGIHPMLTEALLVGALICDRRGRGIPAAHTDGLRLARLKEALREEKTRPIEPGLFYRRC